MRMRGKDTDFTMCIWTKWRVSERKIVMTDSLYKVWLCFSLWRMDRRRDDEERGEKGIDAVGSCISPDKTRTGTSIPSPLHSRPLAHRVSSFPKPSPS